MSADYTPQRVVCLQPSATVILAALGRLDRVVACTKYCADVCPEVRSSGRRIIADSWTAQSQQILAARPDLVIAAVPYQEKAVVEILKAGIRFLGLAPKTLADIYADIATIAGSRGRGRTWTGRDCQHAAGDRGGSKQQVNGKKRPRVFCEEWGKPLIGRRSGWQNWSTRRAASFSATRGRIPLRNRFWRMDPEVIVAAWCGAGDRVPLEKIVRDRGTGNRCQRCARDECIASATNC